MYFLKLFQIRPLRRKKLQQNISDADDLPLYDFMYAMLPVGNCK